MHGKVKPEEAVQATLSSLPDEVVDTVGVTALPSEDSVAERRRKLEFLEMQEELIKVANYASAVSFLLLFCLFIFFMLKSSSFYCFVKPIGFDWRVIGPFLKHLFFNFCSNFL